VLDGAPFVKTVALPSLMMLAVHVFLIFSETGTTCSLQEETAREKKETNRMAIFFMRICLFYSLIDNVKKYF
jgi:hypothetical protein